MNFLQNWHWWYFNYVMTKGKIKPAPAYKKGSEWWLISQKTFCFQWSHHCSSNTLIQLSQPQERVPGACPSLIRFLVSHLPLRSSLSRIIGIWEFSLESVSVLGKEKKNCKERSILSVYLTLSLLFNHQSFLLYLIVTETEQGAEDT